MVPFWGQTKGMAQALRRAQASLIMANISGSAEIPSQLQIVLEML